MTRPSKANDDMAQNSKFIGSGWAFAEPGFMCKEVLIESSPCFRFAVFYAEAKYMVSGATAHAARETVRVWALELGHRVCRVFGLIGSLGGLVALHGLLGRG